MTSEDPSVIACGVCSRCLEARESLDDGRDEAFTRADVAPVFDLASDDEIALQLLRSVHETRNAAEFRSGGDCERYDY